MSYPFPPGHWYPAKVKAHTVLLNTTFHQVILDIRDKYQYFTEAKMEKLKKIGYSKPFHTLEEGTVDYVQNYLMKGRI